MKQKKLIALAGVAMLAVAAVSGTYAYFSDKIAVENSIQSGDIRIKLEDNGQVVNAETLQKSSITEVVPGDTVFRTSKITCEAAPCYIRVLFTNEIEQRDNINPDDISISVNANDWTQLGDYYYYQKPLDYDDSVDLVSSLTIPPQWDNHSALMNLMANIQVDAIQSANFTPDFLSDKPWGNEEIEICAHTGSLEAIVNPNNTMYVEFEGQSHKLLAVPNDFFANLGVAMPGTEFSDTITLKNTTTEKAEFFFHTEMLEHLSEEQKDFLKHISLSITLGDKTLYEGNLEAASLNSDLSLGLYEPNTEESFQFTLAIPKELKNEYARRNTTVKWVFSVRQEDGTPAVLAPQTGDTSSMLFYLLFFISGLSSVIIGAIYLAKYRKDVVC